MVEWTEDGKPSKWITEKEVEWDEEQRDYLFAFLEHEADQCSGCGEPISESAHPLADPANPDREYTYQVSNPIVCFACEAKEKQLKKWNKIPHLKDRGLRAVVRRLDLK